ncbi:MAG: hypothetical protein ACLP19_24275 [Xanthobacteraceae bacterium]
MAADGAWRPRDFSDRRAVDHEWAMTAVVDGHGILLRRAARFLILLKKASAFFAILPA